MDCASTVRVSLQNADEIRSSVKRVAHIQLHHDSVVRVAEEGVPRQFAIKRRKLNVMVVIACHHAVCGKFIGDSVEKAC